MLSLLKDNGNISNFARIIWNLKGNLKGLGTEKHHSKTTYNLGYGATKKINVFAYSHPPDPFTTLFIYISWEKRHMKVLQNLAKENKN